MVEISKEQGYILKQLFNGACDTLVWSYLQGHFGTALADRHDNPSCAAIIVSDFAFIAGDSECDAAIDIVDALCGELCMMPQSDGWGELITKHHAGHTETATRHAFHHTVDGFDCACLRSYVDALPHGYELRRIDHELYAATFEQSFSSSLCINYATVDEYAKHGLGFCALHDGRIVAGASSYTHHDDGIEIEIDTHPDHRRRGLALACAAALILECLVRGLQPSWDAGNPASAALAKKLGYRFSHEYTVYELIANK